MTPDVPPPTPPAAHSTPFLTLGAVFAGLAVICGAFAAHGLDDHFARKYEGQTKQRTGVDVPAAVKARDDFQTGARYQMYHALALLAVGLLAETRPGRALSVAGWAFVVGIVLFSGSLYVLTLTGVSAWGMVTPFGGLAFLVGWAALAVATYGVKRGA